MRAALSRREFLRIVPLSAAGVWAGAAGLTTVAKSSFLPRIAAAQGGAPGTRPFLMVTLGDSVMWGQGLLDEMKFRNIVAGWIQSHLGGRPVRQFAYAHSGAQILVSSGETDYAPNLSGEIPRSYPSITLQAKTAATDVATAGRTVNAAGFTPGDVDLVLIDGGINDVGIVSILLPTNSTAAVKNLAADKCIGRMGSLLTLAQDSFPNAAIVLCGYFQIASQLSDPAQLTAYLGGFMGAAFATLATGFGYVAGLGLSQPAIGQMINNSVTWKNETDAGFAQLVRNANLRYPAYQPRVALASPLFDIDNSYAAPHSYLYNLSDFLSVEAAGQAGFGEPRDPLADVQWTRARACIAAGRTTPYCAEASTGHPNHFGARAYADAVLTQIWTTLAPCLVTRGLVENPVCSSLRSQETAATGTVREVQELLGEMGKEQRDCQAGSDPANGGRGYKPKQCGALENEAEKKKLNASMEQAEARLGPIRQQKLQAGCWY